MNKRWVIALTATTAVMGTPVAASDASIADTEKANAERVICKTSAPTGSRIKKARTCMTKAQWDELADRTKRDMDEFSRTSGGRAPVATNPLTGQ